MNSFIEVKGLVRAASDVTLSYTPNKKACSKFNVASNKVWKDQGGSKHDDTCFIEVTAWNVLAENCNKYVKKGDPLYISGDLKHETWEGKDGQKHSKHSITAQTVVFLKQKES